MYLYLSYKKTYIKLELWSKVFFTYKAAKDEKAGSTAANNS